MMNWKLFWDILSMDSTSGRERAVTQWLLEHLEAPSKQSFEVGDGTLNLLLSWGTPRVVFCSHMDTVPPYIAPDFPEDILPGGTPFASLTPAPPTASCTFPSGASSAGNIQQSAGPSPYPCAGVHKPSGEYISREKTIFGRGSCDAKGQIFAMYSACKELEAEGCTDFGLLLLAGEETGSWGAKAFSQTDFQAPYLVVGEPTENKMVSASKGTLSYDLQFTGEAFHSGYPQYGVSAVDLFNQFYNKLKANDFGIDPLLGETTWNIGLLHSDNPQNILSPRLTCRLYFRTTFVSHQAVQDWMAQEAGQVTLPGAFARTGSQSDAEGSVTCPTATLPGTFARTRSQSDAEGSASCPAVTIPGTFARTGSQSDAEGSASCPGITVTPRGGDTPAHYFVPEGFASAPVAFGSDAPHLKGFAHKSIVGPGSIRTAHRADEQVTVQELEESVALYKRLFRTLQALPQTNTVEGNN